MQFAISSLAPALFALFLFLSAPLASAFTNGTLLPAYLCGPPTDNLPKSVGGYLQYVIRTTNPNGNKTSHPRIDYPLDAAVGGSQLNTQLLVANWHNRNATTACVKPVIFVQTAVHNAPGIINQIVPGQAHDVTLFINAAANAKGIPVCDVYAAWSATTPTADDIANIALDGAIVYAHDANGRRGGYWGLGNLFGVDNGLTPPAATVQAWPPCGPYQVGISHNNLVSGVGQYPNLNGATGNALSWIAPGNLVPGSNVTFQGAAVTDGGFGPHATVLPVVPTTAITSIAGQLTAALPIVTNAVSLGPNVYVFFWDTSINTTQTSIIPTGFSVTATVLTGPDSQTNIFGTATTSPAVMSLTSMNGLKMLGQTVGFKVTASGQTGVASTTSDVAAFNIPLALSNTIIPSHVGTLCGNDIQIQKAIFNMPLDADSQCATLNSLINVNAIPGGTTNIALHQQRPFAFFSLFASAFAYLADTFF